MEKVIIMLGKDVNEGKKCARKKYPNIILFFFFWKSPIRNRSKYYTFFFSFGNVELEIYLIWDIST